MIQNILCALEKNMDSDVVRCSQLEVVLVYSVVLVHYILAHDLCLLVLSIIERGVLKSPIIIVDVSISPCSSIRFSFMSSCVIDLSVIMKRALLSLVVFLSLKSTLILKYSLLLSFV